MRSIGGATTVCCAVFFCCVRLHMVLIHVFAVSNHTDDMSSICLAILFAALFDLYWKINAEVDGSFVFSGNKITDL
jgi:uncharacterized membrane protein YadS